ncbi:acyl transferase/acyl hydrolase/lysophospholipase [Hypoxylon sp. FL1284]|nr:acyl transferase/acyl hydrolase/lysophospholipase [Hypoxylon sp. FL1284]
MHQINARRRSDSDSTSLQPGDIFHLIGGTSMGGGIVAIMLGPLNMEVDDCIEQYRNLGKKVFSKENRQSSPLKIFTAREPKGLFKASTLGDVTEQLCGSTGLAPNAPFFRGQSKATGNSFVLSLHKVNMGQPVFWRTYHSPLEEPIGGTIKDAVLATTAAPPFFTPAGGKYVDAALKYNNPIKQVLEEAMRQYGPSRRVKAIVSLGTGHPGVLGIPNGPGLYAKAMVRVLEKIVTNCEEQHEDWQERLRGWDGLYYRFNVDYGAGDIGMEEYKRLDELDSHTDVYLKKPDIRERVGRASTLLSWKGRAPPHLFPTLGEILGR